MKNHATAYKLMDREPESRKNIDEYYSVEFALNELDIIYQYKIWNIDPSAMCVLVKDQSDILPCLKKGIRVNSKFYSTNASDPIKKLDTRIQYIKKQDQGRLRGHYLVGFKIETCKESKSKHLPYFSNNAQLPNYSYGKKHAYEG